MYHIDMKYVANLHLLITKLFYFRIHIFELFWHFTQHLAVAHSPFAMADSLYTAKRWCLQLV